MFSEIKYRKVFAGFSILQCLLWSSWVSFLAFVSVYLSDRGFSKTDIGLAIGCMTLMSVAGQLTGGYICDRLRSSKKIIVVYFIGLIIAVNIFRLLDSITAISVMLGVIGFLWAPLSAIIDVWILTGPHDISSRYGMIRAFGSVGDAITSAVYGVLLGYFGWNFMFIAYTGIVTSAIITAIVIPDRSFPKVVEAKKDNSGAKQRINPLEMLGQKGFVSMLAALMVIFVPSQMIIYFLSLILKDAGGSTAQQGLSLFIMSATEIPMLFFGSRLLKRFDSGRLVLISTIFYVMRIILYVFASTPNQIVAISVTQCVTYALFTYGIRNYVSKIAPVHLAATAMTMVDAVLSTAGVLCNISGGYALDRFGKNNTYTAGAIIAAMGCIMLFFSLSSARRSVLNFHKNGDKKGIEKPELN